MDRIKTAIESSFMGLAKQAPCPVCGETITVSFGFTSLMLCPNCGDYLEVVDNMLCQMEPTSVSSIPAFAAPTPWADMHAPRVETISFFQWDDLIVEATEWALTKKAGARVLNAQWPNVCCVCGAPPTRVERTARTFIFTPPGLIRVRSKQATMIATGIPHCSEHEQGAVFERAMFSTPGQTTVVGLFFRSYAYQIQFRKLNPWRWTDEGERQAAEVAAAPATGRVANAEGHGGPVGKSPRWKVRLTLGLGVAAAILIWRPWVAPEPPAPLLPQSESPNPPHMTSSLSPGAIAMQDALASVPASDWNGESSYVISQRIHALGTLSDMRELAESGNSRAQILMGVEFDYGHYGGTIDMVQANEWYRRAAAAGEPGAQSALGWRYEHGVGVTQNSPEAARLLAAAAVQGMASAQSALGVILYEGRQGVPQNEAEGLMWLRRAAAGDSRSAQDYLTQHNIPWQ
jgi:hypothetical protein